MKEAECEMWGLTIKLEDQRLLLGIYCWQPPLTSALRKALFRTRREAREAKRTCCYSDARVERVDVTIRSRTDKES